MISSQALKAATSPPDLRDEQRQIVERRRAAEVLHVLNDCLQQALRVEVDVTRDQVEHALLAELVAGRVERVGRAISEDDERVARVEPDDRRGTGPRRRR